MPADSVSQVVHQPRAPSTTERQLRTGRVDVFLQALEADPLFLPMSDGLDQLLEGASQPIQASNHQGIPGSQMAHGISKPWPVGFGAGDVILENSSTAGRFQGIELEVECLVIR